MSKAKKKPSRNLDGKGMNIPGARLVFQVTRYRVGRSYLDWTRRTAVCAFSELKQAITWIEAQRIPEDYRIDRKHLIQLEGKWYPVNVYPYKVKIDDPTAPDVTLDATGMRASHIQTRKENYE
jgi:hypothetical protein